MRSKKLATSMSDVVPNDEPLISERKKTMFVPSDKAQIAAMRRMEHE